VKEEAQLALHAGKLLPVRIDETNPPIGFRRTHAANLGDWTGAADHRQWTMLLGEVRDRLANAPAAAAEPARTPQPAPQVRRAAQHSSPAPKSAAGRPNKMILIGAGAAALVALVVLVSSIWPSGDPQPLPIDDAAAATDAAPELAVVQQGVTPVQVDPRAADLAFWRSCCDRANTGDSDYLAYLSRFPEGQFSDIAQQHVGASGARTAPAAPPPRPAATSSSSANPLPAVLGVWDHVSGNCASRYEFVMDRGSLYWRFGSVNSREDYRIEGGRVVFSDGMALEPSGNTLTVTHSTGQCRFRRAGGGASAANPVDTLVSSAWRRVEGEDGACSARYTFERAGNQIIWSALPSMGPQDYTVSGSRVTIGVHTLAVSANRVGLELSGQQICAFARE